MTEEVDNRPYSLRTVGIDGHEPERTMPAYSNHDKDVGEWPVFTREQVETLVANTESYHFQPIWIEEIGTYAVVRGYANSLPENFDVSPYMEQILKMEEVESWQDGNGFEIAYPEKRIIEIDGEQIETFSFDHIGWDFYRADEPAPAPDA